MLVFPPSASVKANQLDAVDDARREKRQSEYVARQNEECDEDDDVEGLSLLPHFLWPRYDRKMSSHRESPSSLVETDKERQSPKECNAK